ncbi:hypothetical protein [Streptomyces sp. MA5143a]|uniref:hypothetical protein n=1 Tax=Streptomyces sp. MA5143a TaxID=2083010 RepID=UPI0015E77519|nr:hypothetical protein [Streptomyces sp. MA5143a]
MPKTVMSPPVAAMNSAPRMTPRPGMLVMADVGTKLIRRWLIWSAVTMATMCDRKASAWC